MTEIFNPVRDTIIQGYIDLWEKCDALPDSPTLPPTPPPKDPGYEPRTLPTISEMPHRRSLAQRLTERKLEGRRTPSVLHKRRPSPLPVLDPEDEVDKMIQECNEIFGSRYKARRRNSDSTITTYNHSVAEPDTPLLSPSLSDPPTPYSSCFASIALGNPFEESVESEKTTTKWTSPDDLWKLHRPSIFQETCARKVSTSSRNTTKSQPRRNSSVPSLPRLNRPAAIDLEAVRRGIQVERALDSATTWASEYYNYENPIYRSLSPAPPLPSMPENCASPEVSPLTVSQPFPRPVTPSTHRTPTHSPHTSVSSPATSPTSSICSSSPRLVSKKALELLGIKSLPQPPSPARPARPARPSEDDKAPNGFEVSYLYASHRRTGSGHSSSSGTSSPPRSQPSTRFPTAAAPYDATLDAACIYRAIKKSKKIDTDLLTATVVAVSHEPEKLVQLRSRYKSLYAAELTHDIRSATSGSYRTALTRLVEGPHESEAQWLNQNEGSFFMDDKLVAEALFGKDPADLKAIRHHYEQTHGHTLQSALEKLYITNTIPSPAGVWDTTNLTGVFGAACIRALRAEREVETVEARQRMSEQAAAVREASLRRNARRLYQPMKGGSCRFLDRALLVDLALKKSDLWLAELNVVFREMHGVEILELVGGRAKVAASGWPVNLAYALSHALAGAISKPMRDAQLIDSCFGHHFSLNADRLTARMLRAHFDRDPRHMMYVKDVYRQRYGRSLEGRVRKETKGPYRDLLLKLLEGKGEEIGFGDWI